MHRIKGQNTGFGEFLTQHCSGIYESTLNFWFRHLTGFGFCSKSSTKFQGFGISFGIKTYKTYIFGESMNDMLGSR